MLSPIQANVIANQILADSAARKHERTSAVPYRYRCKELEQIPPHLRREVVARAVKNTNNKWQTFAWLLLWLAAVLLFIMLSPASSGFGIPMATHLVALAIHRILVRREVCEIAVSIANHEKTKPSEG